MTNRIYLQAFNQQTTDDVTDIGEAGNKYPILWAALFSPEDFIVRHEAGYDWRILRVEVNIALDRFNRRLPALKQNLPQEVRSYFNKWHQLIESISQDFKFIQVRIEEYAAFFILMMKNF